MYCMFSANLVIVRLSTWFHCDGKYNKEHDYSRKCLLLKITSNFYFICLSILALMYCEPLQSSGVSTGSDGNRVRIYCVARHGWWEPSVSPQRSSQCSLLLNHLCSSSRKYLSLNNCHTPSISQVSLIP